MYRVIAFVLLLGTLGLMLPGKTFAEAPRVAAQQNVKYTTFLPMVHDGHGNTSNLYDSTVIESQLLVAINSKRQAQGCAALTEATELGTAARQHSYDMAYNDFYAHSGSDGSDAASRVEQAGYHWLSVAEIIAAGPTTVDEVVQLWMNSPNHRDAILDCSLTEVGTGFVYLENDPGSVTWHAYWTVDFGTR